MPRLKSPRIRSLGKVTGLTIYLVSGEHVRNEIDPDFTQGGNEAIYHRYVPAGEIWLDDAMHTLDRMATALHEIVERDLMLRRGLPYETAHDIALARERVFRRELQANRPRCFDAARVTRALQTITGTDHIRKQLDKEVAEIVSRVAAKQHAKRRA